MSTQTTDPEAQAEDRVQEIRLMVEGQCQERAAALTACDGLDRLQPEITANEWHGFDFAMTGFGISGHPETVTTRITLDDTQVHVYRFGRVGLLHEARFSSDFPAYIITEVVTSLLGY